MPPDPMTEQAWKRMVIDDLYMQAQWEGLANANRLMFRLASESAMVKSDGPLDAAVIIVGEAPGNDEVIQGRPFVGPSGRLLDALLPVVGLSRGHCYVTNVVPWRPRANRAPTADEIMACRPRLMEEVKTVGAPLVISLGSSALLGLTGSRRALADCHGSFLHFGEAPPIDLSYESHPIEITAARPYWSYVLMPTYHPSAALRDKIAEERIHADFERLGEHCQGGIKRE